MSHEFPAETRTPRETRAITLAHLSDPHLPPPPVRWQDALNKRALSLLSWKKHRRHVHLAATCAAIVDDIAKNDVDAILVSGDLTNFGTPDEFALAANWLKQLPAPAIVIPGNHDCMIRQPAERGILQWKTWSAASYPYARIHDGVAVVGVNSGVPTPPFMAYGRVGRRQLARLEILLTRLGEAGLCRVVMIHHPPRRGLVTWRKALHDYRAFARVLRQAGAEIVLHGHSHDATLTHIPGTDIPLLGVASASLTDKREHRQACWNHLSIHPQDNGWAINMARHRPNGRITEKASWVRPRNSRT